MSKLTKESCITILSNSVEIAQKRGTYLLQEASLLKKAVDFFNKELKEKPDFGSTENPEIVAINLLLQGVTKAQTHRECPFNLHDAALLFDVYEFLVKDSGKDVAQNVSLGSGSGSSKKESKKSAVSALQAVTEEDSNSDSDDNNEIRPLLVSSRKGKDRA
jgi:hypothetical protein